MSVWWSVVLVQVKGHFWFWPTLIEDIVWSTASIDVIYSSITVCDYFRGVGRGFSRVSGNPPKFLVTLLKLESNRNLVNILLHKYWNRNYCMEVPHCHFSKETAGTRKFWGHNKENDLPYSGKISRVKVFKVDLPQNSSQIKFRGSTRLSLHYLYVIIRFSRINFRGNSEIHENSEIYCPQKIPAIRYQLEITLIFQTL